MHASTLAPAPSKRWTIVSWPADEAMINGVHLESSRMSTLTDPCSRIQLTMLAWPPEHAQCKMVRPESSVDLKRLQYSFDDVVISREKILKWKLFTSYWVGFSLGFAADRLSTPAERWELHRLRAPFGNNGKFVLVIQFFWDNNKPYRIQVKLNLFVKLSMRYEKKHGKNCFWYEFICIFYTLLFS